MRCLLFNRPLFCQSDSQRQTGFTLIEILLVIVLLGVVSIAAINAFDGNEDQGRENVTRLEMAALQKALIQFRRDNREMPCMAYLDGRFSPNTINTEYGTANYLGFTDDYVPVTIPANAAEWQAWCQDDFVSNGKATSSNALRMLNIFPYDIAGFDFLLWETSRQSGWNGPYISQEGLTDGWGNPYLLLDPELAFNQSFRCLADAGGTYELSGDAYDCQPITAISVPADYPLPADIVRIVSTGENGILETVFDETTLDEVAVADRDDPCVAEGDDLVMCILR